MASILAKKEEIIARALAWKHSPNGRVIKAINKVFSTTYPPGTNLIIKFMEEFIGMPYGHVDKVMDNVTDCAEYLRTTVYVWIGIDPGNFTDAQYKSSRGVTISTNFADIYSARPLDFIFYNTSSSKITGHVAAKRDDTTIIQSGASDHNARVGISAITWNRSRFMCIRRFLTDEQYASVIVGGVDLGNTEAQYWRLLKNTGVPYTNGADVLRVQTKLQELGYFRGSLGGNYGPITESAVIEFQKAMTIKADGIVGPQTWGKLFSAAPVPKPPVSVVYTRLLKNEGKPYMRGDDVVAVQEALTAAGYKPGEIDGVYGPMTEEAVKAYQKANGLTVDGIVGPKTWSKLIG